jgi:hypothetical protein
MVQDGYEPDLISIFSSKKKAMDFIKRVYPDGILNDEGYTTYYLNKKRLL